MQPIEFTINLTYVFVVIYGLFKGSIAVWITKREFQYPIWNKQGIQIERQLHHKIRAFLRNFIVNPEWGFLKLIALVPVFLATGKRFLHYFMPWKVQRPPPRCTTCKDKGTYLVPSLLKGVKGSWQICNCQENLIRIPNCVCVICLDKGNIGPNRPCPHCEHRAKTNLPNPSICSACNTPFNLAVDSVIGDGHGGMQHYVTAKCRWNLKCNS